MIYTKNKKKGSNIGIFALSDGAQDNIKINKYHKASDNISGFGYNLNISKNINKSKRGRSASAIIRAREFNEMISDKKTDFLLCASGGEFAVETLSYINFKNINKNPKWIAGFSDPTSVLFPITTLCDIATIYGQNFSSFGMNELHESQEYFLETIKGNIPIEKSFSKYEDEYIERVTGTENYNLTKNVYWRTLDDKSVIIEGRIIGGCLDIIAELAGTKYDGTNKFIDKYKKDGIVWYFDNCELSMEEVIRLMWKFNELGYFKHVKAIIFGRFGQSESYLGYDVKSCLKDSVLSSLNVPIIFEADISHKSPCLTIINGSICHLEVKKGKAKLRFMLK